MDKQHTNQQHNVSIDLYWIIMDFKADKFLGVLLVWYYTKYNVFLNQQPEYLDTGSFIKWRYLRNLQNICVEFLYYSHSIIPTIPMSLNSLTAPKTNGTSIMEKNNLCFSTNVPTIQTQQLVKEQVTWYFGFTLTHTTCQNRRPNSYQQIILVWGKYNHIKTYPPPITQYISLVPSCYMYSPYNTKKILATFSPTHK